MTAIHLCIDMQNVETPKVAPSQWDVLKANIAQLADGLGERGIETIYIAYVDEDLFDKGVCRYSETTERNRQLLKSWGDFGFAIDVPTDALVGIKANYSAYQEEAITGYIMDRGISTIILSGVLDHCCVRYTALDFAASFVNYQVIVAAEATDAGVKTSYAKSTALGRRKVHQKRLGNYEGTGVRLEFTKNIFKILDRQEKRPLVARSVHSWARSHFG